jgi:hypothetical protein
MLDIGFLHYDSCITTDSSISRVGQKYTALDVDLLHALKLNKRKNVSCRVIARFCVMCA